MTVSFLMQGFANAFSVAKGELTAALGLKQPQAQINERLWRYAIGAIGLGWRESSSDLSVVVVVGKKSVYTLSIISPLTLRSRRGVWGPYWSKPAGRCWCRAHHPRCAHRYRDTARVHPSHQLKHISRVQQS